jgi:mediator of RNA polymerase II transcription subunit 6
MLIASVLPYFAESPFFDKTSNNASITTQAFYRPDQYYLLQTREAFEGRLRSMAGLEFMVVQDPSNNGKVVENSGVWVIRKQNRRKNHGREDELTPLSAYFVIGENIYMAPSVGNILTSRLVGQ